MSSKKQDKPLIKKATKPRVKRTYISQPLPAEGVARKPSVLQAVGISSSTLRLWIKSGKFPAGFLIGQRTRVWPVEDVRAFLESIKTGEAAQ